ncbi:glycosyltransferase [Hirschia litorea]|uniref:Glycosyltransferase n=1 Tax=Hirschia litorea TaxID=1199156 RepID=A0ABW2IQ49_9PROT
MFPENISTIVVTRTRNREHFLRRAALSLAEQTDKNFIWCIVNDGGDISSVEEIKLSFDTKMHIHVEHLEANVGMEAAGNVGLEFAYQYGAEFAVLHDDDDSWNENFLAEMVQLLSSDQTAFGVVCDWLEIYEKLDKNGRIRETKRSKPFSAGELRLPLLAVRNRFPPIAFLFRVRAWKDVGRFDPTYPVLGDWDFNLRMLFGGEILVCKQTLSHQHIRDTSIGDQANSIRSKLHLHRQMKTRLVNHYARLGSAQKYSQLGVLLAMADQLEDVFKRQSLKERLKRLFK